MMAPSLKKLKSMDEEELVEAYDKTAESTQIGISFILEEIRSREAERLNQQVVRLTRKMTFMNFVITVATILNVVVFLNDRPAIPGFLK